MKRVLLVALLTCASIGVNAAFLEDISKVQQAVSAKSKTVFCEGGVDGMSWQYFELKKAQGKYFPHAEFSVKAYKNPAVLIVPVGRGYKTERGEFIAITGKKKKSIGRLWERGFNLQAIHPKYLKSDKFLVKYARRPHFVWVGEKETLQKLWDEYLAPDYLLYSQQWLPLMDKYKLSGTEQFNELKVMKGKDFPSSPSGMAKMYVSGCVTGLKAKVEKLASAAKSWAQAEEVRKLYQQDCEWAELKLAIEMLDADNMKQALADMELKFPAAGLQKKYAAAVAGLAAEKAEALSKIAVGDVDAGTAARALLAKARQIALANPLLDDMELVAVRRQVGAIDLHDHELRLKGPTRMSPSSFGSSGRVLGIPKLATHTILTNIRNENDWHSEIVKLSDLRGEVKVSSLYSAPQDDLLIGNARLNWDGNRVAFTMGSHKQEMTLYELNAASGEAKRLSPDTHDHFVDTCYLPNGKMVVMSTAIMTGLPCEGGSHLLSNMYLLDPETGKLRQLGVDQENSYHATVTEDGKVMYIRYEYTDSAHYFPRIVMTMNPDGTNQREIYGSNSVWPTSLFYPQPIPGKPNLFSAVVSGHHGPSHMGRLVLFDVSKGRREAGGAVQFIGAKDEKIQAVMVDRLYGSDYPKYMYSVPLDSEYYLTMLKPSQYSAWGLYLVDRFDNKTLIYASDSDFIAWPQVMKKKPTPPLVPNRVREDCNISTLYVQDMYEGPGLKGVPRGTVKELAVYAFHYGFKSAASHSYIGIESGWDGRYLLGTVPVNADGSVMFEVPAMMPVSLMPLDAEGRAVQKMRTWINPQPGEYLSCIGCHETADHAPLNRMTQAAKMKPQQLKPWMGPKRPYSFVMEMQPVLDQYCVSCHNGSRCKLDLRNDYTKEDLLDSKHYSKSYTELQKYVRRNGPESDYKLMVPTEWHASSSTLVQMLKKGHHGVKMDEAAWRKLYMWIDLNVPFHGSFHPKTYGVYGDQAKWRADGFKKYAGLDWNVEAEYKQLVEEYSAKAPVKAVYSKASKPLKKPALKGWPFAGAKAGERMTFEFGQTGREIISYIDCREITKTLSDKERIEFVRIPAGQYVMGDDDGYPNEKPRIVTIKKSFWMSVAEITNSQLQTFDPQHDSRFADIPEKDQTSRGVPLYTENQPAARVSHQQAVAFCEWLSKETGKKVSLPTEEQWEWAARAGTDTDTWYGDRSADFTRFANLSDKTHRTRDFVRRGSKEYFRYVKDMDDKYAVSSPVKSYQPNVWGLYDMIGNVEEWTATADGKDKYVVKGGSWFDMPKNATSATRWSYDEFVRLPDLGFRVIIED